jgi:putative Holliday junction resolvase
MNILGIDYGRKKVGLALGDTETKFAEPLKTLRYQDFKILVVELKNIVSASEIGKVIVGVSEGKMAEETREFGKKLQEKLGLPVIFQDETLTTYEAKELSIKAGIKRKKRRAMEDAYSASLILQNYLDAI